MIYNIKMKDGSVRIMHLISGTVEEALNKWHPLDREGVESYEKISLDQIPKNRENRDLWDHDLKIKEE